MTKPIALSLPVINRVFKEIDKKVEQEGLSEAMENLFWKIRSKIQVTGKTKEIEKALNGPVLVILNHPSVLDPFLTLAYLPKRKDCYLVAISTLLGLGDNIDKAIIPMYLDYKTEETRKIHAIHKLFRRAQRSIILKKEEAQKKNRESIDTAARVLNSKGMVVLTPQGGSESDSWKCGVGFLINQIDNPDRVKVVFVHIKGTSKGDLLRFIPGVSTVLPRIEISFIAWAKVNRFKEINPKISAKTMELFYKKWTKYLN